MIISHTHKFIFFHNPKCAGTSFRAALAPYHDDPFTFWGIFNAPYFRNVIDHTHLRLWEMEAQFPDIYEKTHEYNSIVFVRSPYARFLSAMSEHLKKFWPAIDIQAMTPLQRSQTVEVFIAKILNISRIITDWRFIHFSPQIWYLTLGKHQVPRHIVPMLEKNPDAFAKQGLAVLGLPDRIVPHYNPSPVDLYAALGSSAVRAFIQDFYEDDFAFFRARPSLAILAEIPG